MGRPAGRRCGAGRRARSVSTARSWRRWPAGRCPALTAPEMVHRGGWWPRPHRAAREGAAHVGQHWRGGPLAARGIPAVRGRRVWRPPKPASIRFCSGGRDQNEQAPRPELEPGRRHGRPRAAVARTGHRGLAHDDSGSPALWTRPGGHARHGGRADHCQYSIDYRECRTPSMAASQAVVSYLLSAMTGKHRATVGVIVAAGVIVAKSVRREARQCLVAVSPLWNQPLLISVDQNSDSPVPLGRRFLRGRKYPVWSCRHARATRAAKKFKRPRAHSFVFLRRGKIAARRRLRESTTGRCRGPISLVNHVIGCDADRNCTARGRGGGRSC